MMEIEAMTDAEVRREIEERGQTFTRDQFLALEAKLRLRAACLHWTGDPMKQPARAVLCAARQVQAKAESEAVV